MRDRCRIVLVDERSASFKVLVTEIASSYSLTGNNTATTEPILFMVLICVF